MFKLIILNNNLESIKNLCNCILNEVPDVQISGFTTNIEEFHQLFKKVKPNIIMMDYTDYINSKYCQKSEFKHLKIIFCDFNLSSRNTSKQLFILKKTKPNEMLHSICKFVSKENRKLLRKKIIKMLEPFRFDFKLIGTTYIVESILYCYENQSDYVFENLEKNVYPFVAIECKTNVESIKWATIRATNSMNAHLSLAEKKILFGNFNLDISEKATAKQLISTIVTKLC